MAELGEQSISFNVFIAILMVVTGSINTIAAKWADNIVVDGTKFNHPFFQAACMFLGELSCLFVFFIVHWVRKRMWLNRHAIGNSGAAFDLDDDSEEPKIPKFNPFIFLPPALCDVIATSLSYTGLNLTTASSYQMLRGAVIIFTGLLSVAFLRMRLQGYRWLGMVLVTAGLVVVGVTDIYYDDPTDDVNGIITGNLLIIMAQIIVAIQMVTEQKFLLEYDVPPLLAVGLEGLFGLTILTLLMFPMYFIHVPATFSKNPFHRLEDIIYAFKEMRDNPMVIAALALTLVSIAFFNFAGVTISKKLSATTRMVLDSIIGFGLLVFGMFVYNDILFGPYFRREIMPRMSDRNCHSLTLCCTNFCGIDFEPEHERLMDQEEID